MSNEMRGLDRWITGSYGEDQFKNDLPEVEDEGATMLQDAIDYLESSQPFKELVFCYCDAVSEAVDIMDTARVNCLRQYECRFCGKSTGKKNSWCSPQCYKADSEGL